MILVRHTTIVPAPGVCYGQFEMPLAETFEVEVPLLLSALPFSPTVIWTSPSARCRGLAERIRGEAELKVDSRLTELNFGQWEGRRWDDLHGLVVDHWMQDPWTQRPPGGETAAELWARVGAFRAERLLDPTSASTIVVTHAGVIRAWRSLAEKRPWLEMFSEKIAYGSVWTVE